MQDLILRLKLPEEMIERLDARARAEYLGLWQAAQAAPPEPLPLTSVQPQA